MYNLKTDGFSEDKETEIASAEEYPTDEDKKDVGSRVPFFQTEMLDAGSNINMHDTATQEKLTSNIIVGMQSKIN